MFCCTLLHVHSSIAIILIGKRKLVALLNLSSWCLVMVERLFLAVPWGCLRFMIVVFPDHTHLLFLTVSQQNHSSILEKIKIFGFRICFSRYSSHDPMTSSGFVAFYITDFWIVE